MMPAAMRRGPALIAAFVLGSGCAQLRLRTVSTAEEVELGRETSSQVERAMGIVEENPALTTLIGAVGSSLARTTGHADLPWTFRVVDDAGPNAFALPGGFVYVTRGLVALLVASDELAAALAHEIAHVTARHGLEQLQRVRAAQRRLALFRVLDPGSHHVGRVAEDTAAAVILSYGRESENEADELALRTLAASGRPPSALLALLGILAALPRDGAPPPWLSTHPEPERRITRVSSLLGGTTAPAPAPEPAYLDALEGLAFGPDPRGGYFLGRRYVSPRHRLRAELPEGWSRQLDRSGMQALSPDGQCLILILRTEAKTPEEAAQRVLSRMAIVGPWVPELDGTPAPAATFRISNDPGLLVGRAGFLAHRGIVHALIAVASESAWPAHAQAADAALLGVHRLDHGPELDVEPLRLHVVRPTEPTPLHRLAARADPRIPPELIARLNRMATDAVVPAGTPVKLVRGRGRS